MRYSVRSKEPKTQVGSFLCTAEDLWLQSPPFNVWGAGWLVCFLGVRRLKLKTYVLKCSAQISRRTRTLSRCSVTECNSFTSSCTIQEPNRRTFLYVFLKFFRKPLDWVTLLYWQWRFSVYALCIYSLPLSLQEIAVNWLCIKRFGSRHPSDLHEVSLK